MTGVTQENGIRRVFALLMVALLAVMPVYVALAEIQATPIVDPTPMEEVKLESPESVDAERDGAVEAGPPPNIAPNSVLDLVLGEDYTFECSPVQSVVSLHATVESTCTVAIPGSIIGAILPFSVHQIRTAIENRSGWTVALLILVGENWIPSSVPGTYSFQNRPLLSLRGASYSFKIRMTKDGCQGDSQVNVTVTLVFRYVLLIVPVPLFQDSASMSVSVTQESVLPSSETIMLHADNASRTVPFSLSSSDIPDASISIGFTVQGCAPRHVTASMSEFSWDEKLSGAPEPSGNTRVPAQSSATHGMLDTSQPSTVAQISFEDKLSVSTGSPTHVLTITPQEEPGIDGTAEINLEYTIPANTPVGTYTATITVTISSDAPD